MASLVWRVQDLVVKDREVQGKTETDGVGWGKVGLCDLGGRLVSLEGLVRRSLPLVAKGELGEIAVVVTLPAIRVSLCAWKTSNECAYILW